MSFIIYSTSQQGDGAVRRLSMKLMMTGSTDKDDAFKKRPQIQMQFFIRHQQ